MMTFNIRSMRQNFDNFTHLISKTSAKIHVICLTETWLGTLDNLDDYEIPGYHTPIKQDRLRNKHGGGVMTYIHKDIEKHKYNKGLSSVDDFNHCLAVDITTNNVATTILNVYRSISTKFNLNPFCEWVDDECKIHINATNIYTLFIIYSKHSVA